MSFEIATGLVRQLPFKITTTASDLTTDYTTHGVIIIETDTSAHTITLSTADCTAKATYIIKDGGGNAAAQNISVATEGSENIDGSASAKSISTNYGVMRVFSDGSNWYTW